ncbi:MAG: ribosome maturation factor RimP, partial [Calditrichaeota bacterium]|nr:ribosome maturation factor RimP [Calditrichota bacterium]
IDEIGGISLQRCTKASRKISDVLDMNDPLPGKYILEVSSPGTDRSLKNARDFLRHQGKKVEVTIGNEETETKISGIISDVKNDKVILLAGDDKKTINLQEVKLARLVVGFTS